MSDAIRLYIVTDNPEAAARYLLGCGVTGLPGWMKVLSDPFEVEKLPSGSSAMGLFFPSDMRKPAFVTDAYHERLKRGGINYDYAKHEAKLDEWMRHRHESDQRIIAQALADEKRQEQGAAA